MRETVQQEQARQAKSLMPLSAAELLARDGSPEPGSDALAALEEAFSTSSSAPTHDRRRSKVSELDAYAEAHPLTRAELAAKDAAAELRNPKLMGTHAGEFIVPKPPEQPRPEIRPASPRPWD